MPPTTGTIPFTSMQNFLGAYLLFATRTALIFMISTEIPNEGNDSANHRMNQSQSF